MRRILDPREGRAFIADLLAFQARVARIGAVNGLAQTLLKLTVPGRAGHLPGRRAVGPHAWSTPTTAGRSTSRCAAPASSSRPRPATLLAQLARRPDQAARHRPRAGAAPPPARALQAGRLHGRSPTTARRPSASSPSPAAAEAAVLVVPCRAGRAAAARGDGLLPPAAAWADTALELPEGWAGARAGRRADRPRAPAAVRRARRRGRARRAAGRAAAADTAGA